MKGLVKYNIVQSESPTTHDLIGMLEKRDEETEKKLRFPTFHWVVYLGHRASHASDYSFFPRLLWLLDPQEIGAALRKFGAEGPPLRKLVAKAPTHMKFEGPKAPFRKSGPKGILGNLKPKTLRE